MSGFSFDWLDLREPADHAARDGRLLRLAAGFAAEGKPPLIVDLGCGTGSTARAMETALPAGIAWRLVDHDPALLRLAAARIGPHAETVAADLAETLALPLHGARLVTGSALFDLVSKAWIDAFAQRVAAEGAGLYAALTYDGRSSWTPTHPADADILAAFNRHQRGEKGLGRALGPDATDALVAAFGAWGYGVETQPSDWVLGTPDARLTGEHARGVAEAAEAAGVKAETAAAWLAYRLAHAGDADARVVVGHVDLVALPGGR